MKTVTLHNMMINSTTEIINLVFTHIDGKFFYKGIKKKIRVWGWFFWGVFSL